MRVSVFGIRARAFLAAMMMLLLVRSTAWAGSVQWTGAGSNGHYYEVVGSTGPGAPAWGGLSWSDARSLATTAGGYLATITSAGENSFIAGLLESSTSDRAWIGATDEVTEGTFKWADGPEAGNNLTYTNWYSGEPNNVTTTYVASGGPNNLEGEDYAEMYSSRINSGSGKWNDLPNDGTPRIGYVIEYNGAPAAVPLPPAAYAGMALMGMVGIKQYRRNRQLKLG